MKPFKINRNSWHYKLNKYFFNEDTHYMEKRWELRHTNFCSYWRATMFRVVGTIAVVATVVSAVIGLSLLTYNHPLEVASIIGTILSIPVIAILGMISSEKIRETVKSSDSIVIQRYKTYKSKICPGVDYD